MFTEYSSLSLLEGITPSQVSAPFSDGDFAYWQYLTTLFLPEL